MYLEKDKTRAQTRFNLTKKKLKCKNYWRWFDKNEDPVEYKEKIARAARTPKVCSCWMCGNARKYFGYASLQEQRFFNRKDIELYFKEGE